MGEMHGGLDPRLLVSTTKSFITPVQTYLHQWHYLCKGRSIVVDLRGDLRKGSSPT